ncbi:MAG TPA: hypothetical protein PLP42_19990 [Acidobacteriota bacterium]|nr:hypothetical protein [Acidobacteriota bacterium]HRV08998.1 hypothetical protein [Acidobacteriota bacterium]HXK62173.1 hypothetical protein [Acidobacteriota bacterium]
MELYMDLTKIHMPAFLTIGQFTLCRPYTGPDTSGFGIFTCPNGEGDRRVEYLADLVDSSQPRIHITPAKLFGKVYWNDAYAIKVDGLSNTWIDVRFILPNGQILDASSAYYLDSGGFAGQPVIGGTTPGTHVIIHIKAAGAPSWTSVPHVELEIVGNNLPSNARTMNANARVVRRNDGYIVHFPNMPNKSVDLKVSVNGGATQTLYGVWQLSQYGLAYQPIGGGTSLATTKFTHFKSRDESTWRAIIDIEARDWRFLF